MLNDDTEGMVVPVIIKLFGSPDGVWVPVFKHTIHG